LRGEPGKNKLLVLGVGNPLMGDDGIGLVVARALQRRGITGVEIVEAGTPGFGLIDMLSSVREAVLIDAVDAGCAPGAVFWVDPAEVTARWKRQSLHQVGLGDVVSLMAVADRDTSIRIIGIQPGAIGHSDELSRELQLRLRAITGQAAEMVSGLVETIAASAGRESE
jgi:hydrogenase maturation protease